MNDRLKELLIKYSLSHVGSCDTAYNGISVVYDLKKPDEKFILSNGHAGLALYVVLEEHGLVDAEDLCIRCGTHPDRLASEYIDYSTGSLGQGLPAAIGMALANRSKNVYCMISDGEIMEGSIWESFRIIHDLSIKNIKILINANGWGAYKEIDKYILFSQLCAFNHFIISKDNAEAIKENLSISNFLFIDSHSNQKDHYEKIIS